MTPARISETVFETKDHVWLAGTLYEAQAPRAIAVLNGAVGVPERFYAKFAAWLASEQNVTCLTYTYRDMQDTSRGAMRRSKATLADWALMDAPAARRHLRERYPDLPLWCIGHSLGGWLLPMQTDLDGITRVISIASGLVRHTKHPPLYRLLSWLFWFGLGPVATALCGYLPGKTLGLGATLPAGVYWQWRRWCTAGKGVLDVPDLPKANWSRSGAPVRLVSIWDDPICTPEMARDLAPAYEGAAGIDHMEIREPKRPLGHFRLFGNAGRAHWPRLVSPMPGETPDATLNLVPAE